MLRDTVLPIPCYGRQIGAEVVGAVLLGVPFPPIIWRRVFHHWTINQPSDMCKYIKRVK